MRVQYETFQGNRNCLKLSLLNGPFVNVAKGWPLLTDMLLWGQFCSFFLQIWCYLRIGKLFLDQHLRLDII